ncbi:MAG: hypothetical protein U0414_42630 [Polyangiaceae bacterium]
MLPAWLHPTPVGCCGGEVDRRGAVHLGVTTCRSCGAPILEEDACARCGALEPRGTTPPSVLPPGLEVGHQKISTTAPGVRVAIHWFAIAAVVILLVVVGAVLKPGHGAVELAPAIVMFGIPASCFGVDRARVRAHVSIEDGRLVGRSGGFFDRSAAVSLADVASVVAVKCWNQHYLTTYGLSVVSRGGARQLVVRYVSKREQALAMEACVNGWVRSANATG